MDDELTFVEFHAALESDDFDNPDMSWGDWVESYARQMVGVLSDEYHRGDCTNEPISCQICVFENMLKEYREYCRNPEKWREENGI